MLRAWRTRRAFLCGRPRPPRPDKDRATVAHEDLQREARRDRAPLVRRRRRRARRSAAWRRSIADTLRGKRKPQYTPHVDTGDFVVVVNCERIRVTGKKLDRQDLLPPLGLPRRPPRAHAARDARPPARGGHPALAVRGHDAAQPARPRPAAQAQDLRRPGASARGPEARRSQGRSRDMAENRHLPRHRQAQDLRRPRDAHAGHRLLHGQRQAARRVLRPPDAAHDRALAARGHRASASASTCAPAATAAASPARPARCATASPARSSRPIPSCAPRSSEQGFLTRDAREVERKKAGLKGARRRPQFSKR